jgi:hypothetical protein
MIFQVNPFKLIQKIFKARLTNDQVSNEKPSGLESCDLSNSDATKENDNEYNVKVFDGHIPARKIPGSE